MLDRTSKHCRWEEMWKEEVAPLSFVLNMNCSALFALGAPSVGELLRKPLFRGRARARARARVMALASASDASDAVYEQKRALRWRVRRELKSLDPVQRKQQDEAVQNLVLESAWFKSSTSLCAYISCESLREVDTSKIISCILHNPQPIPKKLYVPRVEDKESNMRMLHISSIAELIANSMNILEPTPLDNNGNQREDVMQADKPVDLLLLPGLAFDCSGRRLGRGGGYYDNFIKTYLELAAKRGWQPPLLVALAYSTQILDAAIPVSAHDVPVDAIVSPSGVIPISPNAVERM